MSLLMILSGPCRISRSQLLVFWIWGSQRLLVEGDGWYSDDTFCVTLDIKRGYVTIYALFLFVFMALFLWRVVLLKEMIASMMFLESISLALSGISLQPIIKYFTSDFKSDMIDAVREVLPNVVHKGCFFHLCHHL